MNLRSSRSHAIFSICCTVRDEETLSHGVLHIVDLAGSENLKRSDLHSADQVTESKHINTSLSALGNVINVLASDKHGHVPYRDSKLTRILQNSLNGKSKMWLFCTVSGYLFDHRFLQLLRTLRSPSALSVLACAPSGFAHSQWPT